MTEQFPRAFRQGLPPELGGHPGFGYRTETEDGVLIERDVAIPLRDGTTLYADVFRPENDEIVPAIVCYAPFGKHPHIDLKTFFAGSGIPVERLSEHTPFEVFDPIRWAKEGFAVCVVDAVGNWYSEGRAQFFDADHEAKAGYDCVEHFAAQPWCNGKVGWGGVSYYAMTAWSVAALQPPHLSAILPWDAASDNYRETNFHGGIPSTLTHNWMLMTGFGLGEVEDMEATVSEHPLDDEAWRLRVADWSRVTVPTYAVTEWGNDLHLRGTIEAWRALSSDDKFLDITGGREWADFYSEWGYERQRAFFGKYLRDEDTDVSSWAPVRVAQRWGHNEWDFRDENEFPLARTEYTTYHLNGATGTATATAPASASQVTYDATTEGDGAVFDLRWDEPTEITGYARLRFWVSADAHNDADLFVAFERIDADGRTVPHAFSQMWDDGPVSFGWLRASHRELDEVRSSHGQPVHAHSRRQWLVHATPVPVDVEIWPTNIHFEPGERLRIHIRGTAIHPEPTAPFASSFVAQNRGHHTIHTGGDFDSYVVLPVIPGGATTS